MSPDEPRAVLFDFFGTLVEYRRNRSELVVGDSYEADHVGPESAGIRGYLIDPGATADVPTDRRLGSVLDLEAVLAGGEQPHWTGPEPGVYN